MFKNLLKVLPAVVALSVSAAAVAQTTALQSNAFAKMASTPVSSVAPKDVAADETVYTYAPGGSYNYYRSNQGAEDYNMAIRIADNSLVGAKVVGLRFDLIQGANITNVTGWTSTVLSVSGTENVPTGEEVAYSSPAAGWNEIRFSEPVEITADGIYVGYTLTLTAAGSYDFPIAVGSNNANQGECYVMTPSWGAQWLDVATEVGLPALSMQAILAEVPAGGVGIELGDFVVARTGEAAICQVTANNHFGAAVTSIEYTYEVAGLTGTNTISTDLSNSYGSTSTFAIELPAISENGQYDLTVTVNKVNGVDNVDAAASATTLLIVTDVDFTHRSVVEEFTGTWCGWCPRGYIAMERMSANYPEDFVGLAYHGSDPMDALNVSEPVNTTSYPSACIDRSSGIIDPYYGSGNDNMGIEQEWLAACAQPTPVAIDVKAALSEDESTVWVSSDVTFLFSQENNGYTIAYALLADGLTGTGSSWMQASYYYNYPSYTDGGDDWDVFTSSSYAQVPFNDVVILAPDILGVEGSLPASIVAEETMAHDYTFNLADAVSCYGSTSGSSLVQDVTKLRVVAMVLGSDGTIINANKTNVVLNSSSVNDVTVAPEEAVEVARYSIDGRRLAQPERGVNIVKMSDGTAYKVVVK